MKLSGTQDRSNWSNTGPKLTSTGQTQDRNNFNWSNTGQKLTSICRTQFVEHSRTNFNFLLRASSLHISCSASIHWFGQPMNHHCSVTTLLTEVLFDLWVAPCRSLNPPNSFCWRSFCFLGWWSVVQCTKSVKATKGSLHHGHLSYHPIVSHVTSSAYHARARARYGLSCIPSHSRYTSDWTNSLMLYSDWTLDQFEGVWCIMCNFVNLYTFLLWRCWDEQTMKAIFET